MSPLYWLLLFSTNAYRAAANYCFHYLLTCQLFSKFPFIKCEKSFLKFPKLLEASFVTIINDEEKKLQIHTLKNLELANVFFSVV